jgi:hypothetical protein
MIVFLGSLFIEKLALTNVLFNIFTYNALSNYIYWIFKNNALSIIIGILMTLSTISTLMGMFKQWIKIAIVVLVLYWFGS